MFTEEKREYVLKLISELIDADVIYELESTDIKDEYKLKVIYKLLSKNVGDRCTTIYHSALTTNPKKDNIVVEYKFNGEKDWKPMAVENTYKADDNLGLWSCHTDKNHIEKNEFIGYSIRLKFKNNVNINKDNRFFIDPQNYGKKVNEINITLRAVDESIDEKIFIPQVLTYHDGLNFNEKNDRINMEKKETGAYKTCFGHRISEDIKGCIYVVEMLTKKDNP